jgi:hypothetical protein
MSGLTDELAWLEQWYQEQCDGDWEHHCGVTIETLDNPGWLVQADLRARPAIATDRALAIVGDPPSDTNGNQGGPTWMTCDIRAGKFVGAGDPTQLRAILAQLRSVVEAEAAPGTT